MVDFNRLCFKCFIFYYILIFVDCWVPAQFKASYEKYADSYCWIAGKSRKNSINDFYLD